MVALGDCSGTFHLARLDNEVYVELPREVQEEPDVVCNLKRASKAWILHSMKELTGENLGFIQTRADGCVFFDLGDGRKSGRHVDDFLISGSWI